MSLKKSWSKRQGFYCPGLGDNATKSSAALLGTRARAACELIASRGLNLFLEVLSKGLAHFQLLHAGRLKRLALREESDDFVARLNNQRLHSNSLGYFRRIGEKGFEGFHCLTEPANKTFLAS